MKYPNERKGRGKIMRRIDLPEGELNYLRCLEEFVTIYRRLGEAQKAFNSLVWDGEDKNWEAIGALQLVQRSLKDLEYLLGKKIKAIG